MSVRLLVWTLLLAGFFASTLALSWPLGRELFVSPDENAAFVFATQLAETGKLSWPEPLNLELQGLLHPRSAVGFGAAVVPASFVGYLIVLGLVGKVFGSLAMYLVTPILAVLTVVVWRDVVRRVFGDRLLADLAAFLLLIHPAFWYYSGRVMMHNVAFLACLVIAIWWALARPLAALARPRQRAWLRWLDFGLVGIFLGSALVIRTAEAVWVLAVLAIAVGWFRAQLGWRAIVAIGLGLGLMFGVLLGINTSLYGQAFVTGYTASFDYAVDTPFSVVAESSEPVTETKTYNLLLPFGFHERVIINNVLNYGFKLYPWMSVVAIFGFGLAFATKGDHAREWRWLAAITLGLSLWFAVVYGSWKIVDNPDPKIISLGNSHVRYWLPLFTLASVFAARAVRDLLFSGKTYLQQGLALGILLLMTLLSLQLVLFGHDGVAPTRAALETFAVKRERILALTEPDAIVIVDRADKYLFPHRRVVVPLRSEATYAALPQLLKLTPVYYFGITFPPQDIEYLNQVQLQPLGVRIEIVDTMSEESLYRFTQN